MVHNGKLEDPFTMLRKMANEIKMAMEREQNPLRRQYYADKYVAHLGAEIDAIAITFDAKLYQTRRFFKNFNASPKIRQISSYQTLCISAVAPMH